MIGERRPLQRGPLIVVRPTVPGSRARDYEPTGMVINEPALIEEQWYASPTGLLSANFVGGYLVCSLGNAQLHVWPTIATNPQIEIAGRLYAISGGVDQQVATASIGPLSGPLCGGSTDMILGWQMVLAGSPPSGYDYDSVRFELRVNCPENLDAADIYAEMAELLWIGAIADETVAP